MRNRSFDIRENYSTGVTNTWKTVWLNTHAPQEENSYSVNGTESAPVKIGTSTMTDTMERERKHLPTFRGQPRRHVLPVHNCQHTKVRFAPSKELTVVMGNHFNVGSPLHDRIETRTLSFDSAIAWFNKVWYNPYTDSSLAEFVDLNPANDVGGLAAPDWFHLLDSFFESYDQFVPSAFMVGEDIFEFQLFADALKAIVNPLSAARSLIRTVTKHYGHSRPQMLGHVVRRLRKDIPDAVLSYEFGIQPAIADIVSTLSAHNFVRQRLEFLKASAGGFVPIHARSVFERTPSKPSLPDTYDEVFALTAPILYKVTDSYKRTATISGYGKVREDLSYKSSWAAYAEYFGLNKVFGLAWELIPFSFVVDWFTNAQERLNSMTRLHFGGPYTELAGVCWSDKIERISSLYGAGPLLDSPDHRQQSPAGVINLGKLTETSYTRTTGLPCTEGVFDFAHLGLFHGLTGASLILQRVR